MKIPPISTAKNSKDVDQGQYLTSWKDIARYMQCGVRTVQRYERDFGLPVRRPTGKLRGAVMATRAEIDAWVAAGPIRDTFQLLRVDQNSRAQAQSDKIQRGVIAMRKLREQMQELRVETRTALNLLISRVADIRRIMLPARPDGYEPLVNIDMDMDRDIGESPQSGLARSIQRGGGRRSKADNSSLSPSRKPH